MLQRFKFFFIFYFILIVEHVTAEDIPCLARKEEAGYVCVCNETYCDTIEPPTPLSSGSFYQYMTSEESPGFTKTYGEFVNTSSIELLLSEFSPDVFFLVDPSVQYQTFIGVGAGITDSAGINFNYLSPGAQQKFVESYFGINGIEYTFGRVPIAGTDFSMRSYSYDDVPGDVDLKYFSLTEEDFTLKMPLIKMAQLASRRGLKLLGSSWTAPSWMKTNNSTRRGYLLSEYHPCWANYHLKFLEAYEENGISFWGLTQGNEVVLGLLANFPMPNLIMLPAQLKHWTRHYLGPMLKASKFSGLKVLTLDDERPFSSWWGNRVFSDKGVSQYIDGIALHWYFDSDSNTNLLDEFHTKYPDKFILYTESSIMDRFHQNDAVSLGGWNPAVRYIDNMFQNFDHWCAGYLDWNIVLNEEGGPTYGGSSLDAPVIVNATTAEFYKQPIFYALGHFSKFIPPGSRRVQVTSNQNSSDTHQEVTRLLGRFNAKTARYIPDIETPWPGPPPIAIPESGASPTGAPGPGPSPPTGTPGTGPTPTGPPGPGPSPTGTGPTPTGHPGPPGPTDTPPSTTVLALAAINPDGSRSVIVYNPKSDPVSVVIAESQVGAINCTLAAHSLNTFIYW